MDFGQISKRVCSVCKKKATLARDNVLFCRSCFTLSPSSIGKKRRFPSKSNEDEPLGSESSSESDVDNEKLISLQKQEVRYPAQLNQFYLYFKRANPDSSKTKQDFLRPSASNDKFSVAQDIFKSFILRKDPIRGASDKLKLITTLRQFCIPYGLSKHSSFAKQMIVEWRKSKSVELEIQKSNLVPENSKWKSWESICEILRGLQKTTEEPTASYTRWEQRLLLELYVYNCPLRSNYHCVKILEPEERADLDSAHNWAQIQDDEMMFHLGHDKVSNSSSHEKTMTIPLDNHCLDTYLEMENRFGPRSYLLTSLSDRGAPLDNGQVADSGARYLLKTIPGLDGQESGLCINRIRSAFVTNFLNQENVSEETLENAATQMRTSTDVMRTNYKKIHTNNR